MKGTFLAVGLAAALAVTAGCTADAGSPDASAVATTSVQLPPSYRFEPAVITVASGAAVTWTNADHFTHNVDLADDGAPPMAMAPGESAELVFPSPGRYPYVCSLHPTDMEGVVVVTAQ